MTLRQLLKIHGKGLHAGYPPLASEDEFDAFMTAAAQLRVVLEVRSLDDPGSDDPVAEGGMLLSAQVDFEQAGRRLRVPSRHRGRPVPRSKMPGASDRPIRCPIPGCPKVYEKGRYGWDAHVGSYRMHPKWHPDVRDPEERKRLFKKEFPDF